MPDLDGQASCGVRRAVIFLGPPGAGKGTQARLAAKEFKIPHLSTGDMLREQMSFGTPLGNRVRQYMEGGELVADDLVLEMVEARISQPDCADGFVLDGFPRTLVQAEAFDEILRRKCWGRPQVLYFDVDRKQLLRRLTGRRTCSIGGEIYNIYDNPPKIPGRCDNDGGELIQRADDREDVIAERLGIYDTYTRTLVSRYRELGVSVDINGMAHPAVVAEQVKRILASVR
jgi:adenylate kinase